MTNLSIKEVAKQTISLEANAVHQLADFVDDTFEKVVKLIHQLTGRIVVTGIGKSALIAQKIVATFNSTGTPALFMHAADAIHGDLGMIQQGDAVMIISKSGNSPEIKALIPFIKNFGNPTIALCGNTDAYLAQKADYFINTTVSAEACPNNLAPTSSTTAQLVMGDALAVCLLQLKGFSAQDFAKFHPGGALGKQLYLTVDELMQQNPKPQVASEDTLSTIILEISGKRLGATAVINEQEEVLGIITDGDLRRMLHNPENAQNWKALDICTPNPKCIQKNELAAKALQKMREHNISQLIVVDESRYAGMIHLHDLIREGLI